MGAIVRNVVNDQLLRLSYKDPKNIKRFLRNWGGLESLSEKGDTVATCILTDLKTVTAIDLDKYHKSDRAEFNKAYRKGKLSHYQYMSIAYVLVLGYTQDTCYDLLFYTIKSNATYNFSSKTAEAITQMVCDDMEIPVGSLAQTGLTQKLIVQNVSIYEIIMRAYTQAYQQNGVSYRVVAKKGYLNVEEMGKVVCSIEITEDSNITSSNYKESITNMVNKVRIYDGEGKPQGVVQNDADVKKYGIFQQTYTKEEGKDATTTAKSMFKTVEKTFTLECVNLNEAVTGAGAVVRDSSTGLSGVVWIDADTHTWQNGVATMSLTVTLKQMMDTKEG